MSEMIERVARALARHSYLGETGWMFFVHRGIAIDVIKAMREPTDAMVNAGWKSDLDRDTPSELYNAMIDAALNEKPRT